MGTVVAVLLLACIAWFLYGALFSRRYPRKQQSQPPTPTRERVGSSQPDTNNERE